MSKTFNVTANCKPQLHYMVDITPKLEQIKTMIDAGQYFTINRARQYGKTTTIQELEKFLKDDYEVVSLDFQMISSAKFKNENTFSVTFAKLFIRTIRGNNSSIESLKRALKENKEEIELAELFEYLSDICDESEKPIVLIIDEVDSATNNQVFLDFLAQLRGYYIKREEFPTFQSVILAGVHDVRNIKRKIRSDEKHKVNSPWNIAADFLVDMSFSVEEIMGMITEYESDNHTGMDVTAMAKLIYDYTSGYPFLVSRICKLIDERIVGSEEYPNKKSAWTKEGFLEAIKLLLVEKNTLFESLTGKLLDYPELKELIYSLLMKGERISYNSYNDAIDVATMLGFVKNNDGVLAIANRIFEIQFYNLFLSEEEVTSKIFSAGSMDKNQFIQNGILNMDLVLEKFVVHWNELYSSEDEKFLEDNGRKFFLLYLKPIINGVGNYYIESRTRDNKRTDVIIDYLGKQYIIELKIWKGNAYNERGEEQLVDYLEYYHLDKGYLLSFNFNKRKNVGVKKIRVGEKVLVEAVV
jgi:hypothetical protein